MMHLNNNRESQNCPRSNYRQHGRQPLRLGAHISVHRSVRYHTESETSANGAWAVYVMIIRCLLARTVLLILIFLLKRLGKIFYIRELGVIAFEYSTSVSSMLIRKLQNF